MQRTTPSGQFLRSIFQPESPPNGILASSFPYLHRLILSPSHPLCVPWSFLLGRLDPNPVDFSHLRPSLRQQELYLMPPSTKKRQQYKDICRADAFTSGGIFIGTSEKCLVLLLPCDSRLLSSVCLFVCLVSVLIRKRQRSRPCQGISKTPTRS